MVAQTVNTLSKTEVYRFNEYLYVECMSHFFLNEGPKDNKYLSIFPGMRISPKAPQKYNFCFLKNKQTLDILEITLTACHRDSVCITTSF